jgi:hypothetical protein
MAYKVGIGIGKEGSPFEVGNTAAKQAFDQMGDDQCDLVLVFSSGKIDLGELIKGIRAVTGKAQLVGGTAYREILNGGYEDGAAVIMCMKMAASSGASAKIVTASSKGLRADSRRAGVELAEQMIQGLSIPAKGTMIILPDGTGGNISALIRGIYDTVGAGIQILGGSFANDVHFDISYQFLNEEIFSDGVCGIYFPPEIQIGVGIRHGWFPLGDLILVTKAHENILDEFDNRPALDVYTEKVKIIEKDVNHRGPIDLKKYPLGIYEFGGGYSIQQLNHQTPERGISANGEIPQNSMVSLMGQTAETLVNAAEEAALKAASMIRASAAGKKIKAVLVFNCATRFWLLNEDKIREIKAVRKVFGEEIPIVGFYTFGEIGVLEGGLPRFHNKTIVIGAFGE